MDRANSNRKYQVLVVSDDVLAGTLAAIFFVFI